MDFSKIDYVTHYRSQGLVPIPLHDVASGACSCRGGRTCTSAGKHPRVRRQDAIQANDQTWSGWLKDWPNMNLGILTGTESGVFAVDVDPRHGGDQSLEALLQANGPLPLTPSAGTGGGGMHYLFAIPPDVNIKNSVGNLQGSNGIAAGVDIRGDGGLIVVEPSTTKGAYRWGSGLPKRQDIAAAPGWLISAISASGRTRSHATATITPPLLSHLHGFTMPADASVFEGRRNNFLASAAGWLKKKGLSGVALIDMLKALNVAKCSPPVTDREVEQVASSINKYPGEQSGDDWQTPQPVKQSLPAVPSFDPAMLPGALRPWLLDIADQMQCPVDFLAVGAMVAAGAVVGNRIGVQPKRHDIGWVEVPNLWGAVVGRPGVMKSPALARVLAPLKRLEDKRLHAFPQVLAKYELEKLIYEESMKKIKAQISKGLTLHPSQMPTEPLKPQPPRLLLNDATYQKLGDVLHGNPHGVLVFQDELAGLLVRLEADGQEAARAFYLEAWNGLQPYVFDRIERGTVRLPRLCFSLLGGLQPSKLREYFFGAIKGGRTDDGLAQRLQLLVFPDVPKSWALVDRTPNMQAIQTADQVFDRLDALDPQAVGADVTPLTGGVPTLAFTDAAQLIFNEWWTSLERALRTTNRHPALESHLSKYRKLVPALALLDHLIEGAKGPITEPSLSRALMWGKFLYQHAKRAYASVTATSIDSAKNLSDKLIQGALNDGFTVRDIYRRNWSWLTDRKEVMAAVEILIDADWIRPCNKGLGADGRPAIHYTINPQVQKAA